MLARGLTLTGFAGNVSDDIGHFRPRVLRSAAPFASNSKQRSPPPIRAAQRSGVRLSRERRKPERKRKRKVIKTPLLQYVMYSTTGATLFTGRSVASREVAGESYCKVRGLVSRPRCHTLEVGISKVCFQSVY